MEAMHGVRAAQVAFDRRMRDNDTTLLGFKPNDPSPAVDPAASVTDDEVDHCIAFLALRGHFYDQFDHYKPVPAIYSAIAMQWMQDRHRIGDLIAKEFEQYVRTLVHLSKNGDGFIRLQRIAPEPVGEETKRG